MKSSLLLVWALLLFSLPTVAQDKPEEVYQIDAILIDGLVRTKPFVVTRELLFGEGDLATRAEIEESVQRLRNLGIFRVVEYDLEDRRVPLPGETLESSSRSNHRIMRITIDERWTLIPFGTFSQGGGTFALNTGVFDVNTLGQYIETGFEYIRFGGTNSFGVWMFNPRFLHQRLFFGTTFYSLNNIFYERDDDGEIDTGYFRFRRIFTADLNKEWNRWFRTGIGVSFASDEYSEQLIPDDVVEGQDGVPADQSPLVFSGSVTVGRIDSERFLREGIRYTHFIEGSSSSLGSTIDYVATSAIALAFVRLPLKGNFGLRLGAGISNVDETPYRFFLGGFGEVRGFVHRRFRGTKYWFANAEYRIPSLDSRFVALQHIAFFDIARATEPGTSLIGVSGASTGIGLRIIVPKIFGFVARFDYAFPLVGASGGAAFSFGSQQFF